MKPADITDSKIGASAIERFSNKITMWLERSVDSKKT